MGNFSSMKKIVNWTTANKIATVFGIVGGIFLLFQLYNNFFSIKSKFSSQILIQEIKAPVRLQNYSFDEEIERILPANFDKYDLTELIADSLSIHFETSTYKIRDKLSDIISKDFNKRQAINNIDSLIFSIISPLKANYFVETSITNVGNKTANDLRFEIPTYGYYELFDNSELIRNGQFRNSINIGELRVRNSTLIRIWATGHVSNYYVTESKDIKYTFDEGIIYPRTTEVVISEGVLFWIFKHPFFSLYLFAMILWLTLPIIFQYNKAKKNTHNKTYE